MHRIIEQTAICCGMVRMPNPSSHERVGRPDAEYHHSFFLSQGSLQEMKRQRRPSRRRLRMQHIVLLAAEGLSPTEIARIHFCSRTPVYAVVGRFIQERRAAFDDRNRRGPKPLLEELESEYIERLVEEDSPIAYGWVPSRWSCKLLALELFKERATLLSRETLRRALHRLGFRWRRPRPVPPEKDFEVQKEQKRRRLLDVIAMIREAGSFFQDAYPS
jgi:transposase